MAKSIDSIEGSTTENVTVFRFDLTDLETFIAVVDTGNFTLAAKRLCVSQPSVTGRIQRLEAVLHTRLLKRTTRKVEPTEAGLRLRNSAEAALYELRSVIRGFQIDAEEKRNQIVLAATPGIAAVTLPPLIRAFSDRYTDIQIDMQDLQYEEVLTSLETGSADIGIIAFDGDSSKFRFEPLAEEEMVLVAPVDHPLAREETTTLEKMAVYQLMILDRYTLLREKINEESKKRNLKLQHIRTASNLTTLLGMIDAGNGITFLPLSMAQNNAKNTRATIHVADVNFVRAYGILQKRNTRLSAAQQSFCKYLHQEFSNVLLDGEPGHAIADKPF